MAQRRSRPTLRQVADAAGVSVMTASYVYSQPGRVAPETAAKVRAAADRLDYPGPHPGARSLRRGRAGSLGVILGERLAYAFDDPQAARFLAGVAEVCAAEGVGLTLVPVTGAASDAQRVAEAVVDGFVVWTTSDDDPVLDAVAASRLPAVVHAGPPGRGLPVVGIDDRAAAAAVGRLAFAGAARPAVLSFPVNPGRDRALCEGPPGSAVTYPVTRHRWEGFLDRLARGRGRPSRAVGRRVPGQRHRARRSLRGRAVPRRRPARRDRRDERRTRPRRAQRRGAKRSQRSRCRRDHRLGR